MVFSCTSCNADEGEDSNNMLECDYENGCSKLFKKLEEEDFDMVTTFLDTGYWPNTIFKDTPPADQVRTWVTRFDPDDETQVKWSQLPLHLALVVGAPYDVITRLVDLYPSSVRCTDDQRMLPLHLALRHGAKDEVVEFILTKFPDAVNAKGKNNRTPVECALRGSNKSRGMILQIFVEKSRKKRHGRRKSAAPSEPLMKVTEKKPAVLETQHPRTPGITACGILPTKGGSASAMQEVRDGPPLSPDWHTDHRQGF